MVTDVFEKGPHLLRMQWRRLTPALEDGGCGTRGIERRSLQSGRARHLVYRAVFV